MAEIYRVDSVWQLAGVYEVRTKTFVYGQGIPKELEFDEIYGQVYCYILLEQDHTAVAAARINTSHADYAKIERVAVIPELQNKGCGRLVIEAAERWIRELGYRKIVITSQQQAVGFYESLGYAARPDIRVESTIPVVYTEKEFL
ncbi:MULTISPECIES: GNAT family N-acetyltransferase [unclassified Paenibacillus]|uniref:GNAT family N-acetyltransferase n=1 Tax=unclassified Paenibacillus TaxID=185978 RepID=UPI0008389F9B|nr:MULTISPECIES: GNAT family N-acetyltransferase [unclassified Paenibacillus]NWL86652.1 GNAT family N-acetyltransferase [Paenibacillus sp. 79R4]